MTRARSLWLALIPLLLDARAALAQSEERRRLHAPATIDGIACAPTGRAYAEWHPSGRLKTCPLAGDTTVAGHRFFAGTWIILDTAGLLQAAWLVRDTKLAGHLCKGTGHLGYSVRFAHDETLESCYLARDTVIAGVPCLHGSFWTELRGGGRALASFHPDGSLRECQLSRPFARDGVSYRKWDRFGP